MSEVHFVVPDNIDDPAQPSGGNVYDRRVADGLRGAGWSIVEHKLSGSWPRPDAAACGALDNALHGLLDGSVVLLDGLIASAVPDVLLPQASRLHLLILLHMPLGDSTPASGIDAVRIGEHAVLTAAAAVIATSAWTQAWVHEHYGLPLRQIHVATPGADSAALATGRDGGSELLCVAAVTPLKGHDVLIAALRTISDLSWRCTCVGSVERDPAFVARLQHAATTTGLEQRVRYTGALHGVALERAYAQADVLVLASRREAYGMVITEALARGLPVVATAVGGTAEALGRAGDGTLPGTLVPAEASDALGAALRAWLQTPDLRRRWRRAARERRAALSGWSVTVEQIARALTVARG